MDLVHLPHTWHVPPNSLILLHSRPCVPGQPLLTAMPSPWAHPAHLVVVSEVTDPHVLAHVGVVKVLSKPADITPVEIPLPFAGGRGETEVRTEDLSTAGGLGWGSWGVTLGVSRRWFWAAAAHHVLGEACESENYRNVPTKVQAAGFPWTISRSQTWPYSAQMPLSPSTHHHRQGTPSPDHSPHYATWSTATCQPYLLVWTAGVLEAST